MTVSNRFSWVGYHRRLEHTAPRLITLMSQHDRAVGNEASKIINEWIYSGIIYYLLLVMFGGNFSQVTMTKSISRVHKRRSEIKQSDFISQYLLRMHCLGLWQSRKNTARPSIGIHDGLLDEHIPAKSRQQHSPDNVVDSSCCEKCQGYHTV